MGWLKDPLIFFLFAGAALFAVAQYFGDDEISYAVDVREADLQRLADQWAMQMRRPPTAAELAGLVEQFVKEEIYYREARRLQLDINDTIVRRRMVQKLTFLTEDVATEIPQVESDLRAYYDAHAEDYRQPEKFSFRHRYFSSDRRQAARDDAAAAVEDATAKGDPFMLQREYALRSQREIADLFGVAFAQGLTALEVDDAWQGPVESAYGWHAVQLTARVPARLPAFDEVADQVALDAQQASRAAANEAYYESLKARYDISYPAGE
jgi:parvulin-like peptidyl-prolyl isomerase